MLSRLCIQGCNIKALEGDTGAKLVVRDEGTVVLYAPTKGKFATAEMMLEAFTGADVKVTGQCTYP